MTAPARFLFDECIGKPSMETLRAMVPTVADFAHIVDHFHEGIKDSDWIPRLAAEGGWIVITSDSGKNSKKGDKLPQLCKECGITHVVLSGTLHVKKAHEKIAALAMMWKEIEAVSGADPGSRFTLRYREVKGSASNVHLVLERIFDKAPDPPATPEA